MCVCGGGGGGGGGKGGGVVIYSLFISIRVLNAELRVISVNRELFGGGGGVAGGGGGGRRSVRF